MVRMNGGAGGYGWRSDELVTGNLRRCTPPRDLLGAEDALPGKGRRARSLPSHSMMGQARPFAQTTLIYLCLEGFTPMISSEAI